MAADFLLELIRSFLLGCLKVFVFLKNPILLPTFTTVLVIIGQCS
jgi:hypothetical protein